MNEFKKHIEDKKKRDIKTGQCRNSLLFLFFYWSAHFKHDLRPCKTNKPTTNLTISKPKIPRIIHGVRVCQGRRKKMMNKALFTCVTGHVKL